MNNLHMLITLQYLWEDFISEEITSEGEPTKMSGRDATKYIDTRGTDLDIISRT